MIVGRLVDGFLSATPASIFEQLFQKHSDERWDFFVCGMNLDSSLPKRQTHIVHPHGTYAPIARVTPPGKIKRVSFFWNPWGDKTQFGPVSEKASKLITSGPLHL